MLTTESIRGSSLLPLRDWLEQNRQFWYMNLKKENASSIFTAVFGLYGIVGRNDSLVNDKIVAMVESWSSGVELRARAQSFVFPLIDMAPLLPQMCPGILLLP